MQPLEGSWSELQRIEGVQYVCGFCGSITAPTHGYMTREIGVFGEGVNVVETGGYIYICPNCNRPTFIHETEKDREQVPGQKFGRNVQYLPTDISKLYNEARDCMSVGAYTATAMICRKLLMHIAVEQGAEAGKSFKHYVDHLKNRALVSEEQVKWVDKIREEGNRANHEITIYTMEDAKKILKFVEVLLIITYEFPAILKEEKQETEELPF